jgi:hypothetical protein
MDRACSNHGKKRKSHRVLVGKAEGKRQLGRHTHRWEGHIEMSLREML